MNLLETVVLPSKIRLLKLRQIQNILLQIHKKYKNDLYNFYALVHQYIFFYFLWFEVRTTFSSLNVSKA